MEFNVFRVFLFLFFDFGLVWSWLFETVFFCIVTLAVLELAL